LTWLNLWVVVPRRFEVAEFEDREVTDASEMFYNFGRIFLSIMEG
jgi:hypothetical protein